MSMEEQVNDTEITLGTGRLLGLFFGLVIVCAVFFGLGFSLGRSSVKTAGLTMEEAPSTSPSAGSAGSKSTPGTPEKPSQAVETTASDSQIDKSSDNGSAPVVATTSASSSSASKDATPEVSKGSGSFLVQVAAVSKQEDADALVSALKKKSYPVFVASGPTADKLYHVQIGPFGDIKDAEAMKSRLTNDGYNPILKR